MLMQAMTAQMQPTFCQREWHLLHLSCDRPKIVLLCLGKFEANAGNPFRLRVFLPPKPRGLTYKRECSWQVLHFQT